ncbi:MAG: hypothetical protein KGM47_06630, partial [Acidobacteriota bacterium]|nr:hypothetical protein [Acidobacteriota bacterium]
MVYEQTPRHIRDNTQQRDPSLEAAGDQRDEGDDRRFNAFKNSVLFVSPVSIVSFASDIVNTVLNRRERAPA